MSTFQPPTKQDIREISVGFSSFCTEQKSKSTSASPDKSSMNPTINRQRKIVRARRGSQKQPKQQQQPQQNVNGNDNDTKFSNMNNSEYMEYQKKTEQHRMKRKRKFDVFSSGSNESLHELLQRPTTFRVAYHSMFYVRVDNQNNSQLKQTQTQIPNTNDKNMNNNNSNSNNRNSTGTNTKNAFEMMTKASKAINDWKGIEAKLSIDDDDDNDTKMGMDEDNDNNMSVQSVIRNNNGSNIFYPIREECLITRSVRVSSEWVTAFNEYEFANNIAWKEFNSDGKIHEYQINQNSGLMLLNLNLTINKTGNDLTQFLNENDNDIKQWVIDHGFSGFICDSCFYLFQPHLFWNLLDDNKRSKVKQTLISDMFQSTKTKPANNAYKAWKATF